MQSNGHDQRSHADEVGRAYPYPPLGADGTRGEVERAWWIHFRPVVTHAMYKRARAFASSTVGRGADARVEVDQDMLAEHLWREMIVDWRLPDPTQPGATLPCAPESFDRLPLYLTLFITVEIDKRNGSDLGSWSMPIRGRDADSFRPTAPLGDGQLAEPVSPGGVQPGQ